MRYLCVIYDDEQTMAGMTKEEGEALEPVATATSVRIRNGKLSTTDGPFAETKEQLGGYYLINARDLNDAIQVAAKIPSARTGTVVVSSAVAHGTA